MAPKWKMRNASSEILYDRTMLKPNPTEHIKLVEFTEHRCAQLQIEKCQKRASPEHVDGHEGNSGKEKLGLPPSDDVSPLLLQQLSAM